MTQLEDIKNRNGASKNCKDTTEENFIVSQIFLIYFISSNKIILSIFCFLFFFFFFSSFSSQKKTLSLSCTRQVDSRELPNIAVRTNILLRLNTIGGRGASELAGGLACALRVLHQLFYTSPVYKYIYIYIYTDIK